MLHAEYQAFTHWLYQHHGWAAFFTFIIAALESLIIVGTIIPGSITMTAVGIMMGTGVMSIPLTIGLASTGAFVGDGISYIIGYRFRETLPQKWPFRLVPKLMAKGKDYFTKHGGKSVFIGRFVGAIRAMVPVIAGMMHMKPWQYFPISFCSAILWAILYLLPGFLIGYASEALPPGLASHVIIYIFVFLIAIWIIYWVTKEIVIHFGKKFDSFLDKRWDQMRASKYFRWLTTLIRNAEDPEHHGQFAVTVLFLITFALFLSLLVHVMHQSVVDDLNVWVNHVMRGLRALKLETFMLVLSALASKTTLIPVIVVVTIWLWIKRRRYAACHFFIVAMLAVLCTWLLKTGIHSPRPSGILSVKPTNSFPSGHVTLATVIYAYAAWFIGFCQPKWRKASYWLAALVIILVSISRLYLDDHWLTDTVGGFLLGILFVFAGIISYHRFHAKPIRPIHFIIPLIISVILFATINLLFNFHKDFINSQLVWKEQYIQQSKWWGKRNLLIPEYRKNLLNQPSQVFNIQWAGDLATIKQQLTNNHWKVYLNHRKLDNKKDKKHKLKQLTLFPSTYQAQLPTLIMINSHHQPGLVLRLWNSHVMLKASKTPLWIGTITYNTRPKSLLSQRKIADPKSVFNTLLPAIKSDYQWRIIEAHLPDELEKSNAAQHILMLEPKNIKQTGTTK